MERGSEKGGCRTDEIQGKEINRRVQFLFSMVTSADSIVGQ